MLASAERLIVCSVILISTYMVTAGVIGSMLIARRADLVGADQNGRAESQPTNHIASSASASLALAAA
jgi:hypothetical protein